MSEWDFAFGLTGQALEDAGNDDLKEIRLSGGPAKNKVDKKIIFPIGD